MHYQEQMRQYDLISSDPYSESQRINFLNAALGGIPNLESVLTIRSTAKKAAGIITPDTFDEYFSALLEQAQVYDSANTAPRGPRNVRQVNNNEMVFDDMDDNEMISDSTDINAFSHQFDHQDAYNDETDINTILCNSMEKTQPGRRLARMNLSTWKSLDTADRTAWDTVSDDGKTKILNYASTRGNNKKPNDQGFRIDSHDVDKNDTNIEVGTHHTEPMGILAMATRTNKVQTVQSQDCLLYTSPSPRDQRGSRMPSSA